MTFTTVCLLHYVCALNTYKLTKLRTSVQTAASVPMTLLRIVTYTANCVSSSNLTFTATATAAITAASYRSTPITYYCCHTQWHYNCCFCSSGTPAAVLGQ
jgi:hypothetical protein